MEALSWSLGDWPWSVVAISPEVQSGRLRDRPKSQAQEPEGQLSGGQTQGPEGLAKEPEDQAYRIGESRRTIYPTISSVPLPFN